MFNQTKEHVHCSTGQGACSLFNQTRSMFIVQPDKEHVHFSTRQGACSLFNQTEEHVHCSTRQGECSLSNIRLRNMFIVQPDKEHVHCSTRRLMDIFVVKLHTQEQIHVCNHTKEYVHCSTRLWNLFYQTQDMFNQTIKIMLHQTIKSQTKYLSKFTLHV